MQYLAQKQMAFNSKRGRYNTRMQLVCGDTVIDLEETNWTFKNPGGGPAIQHVSYHYQMFYEKRFLAMYHLNLADDDYAEMDKLVGEFDALKVIEFVRKVDKNFLGSFLLKSPDIQRAESAVTERDAIGAESKQGSTSRSRTRL